MDHEKTVDEGTLVDAYYYDYILTMAIEVYLSRRSPVEAATHLRVATDLCKQLRVKGVGLDREIYMKEAYLKALQVLRFYKDKLGEKNGTDLNLTVLLKGFECLRAIMQESTEMRTDPEFRLIVTVHLAVYKAIGEGRMQGEMHEIHMFIVTLLREDTANKERGLEKLLKGFTEETGRSFLSEIRFRNPVMKKFTDYVKEQIDKKFKGKVRP